MGVSPQEDFFSSFHLLSRDDRFPFAAQRFRSNLIRHTDNPSSICPVVKDIRQAADIRFPFPGGRNLNEWSPGTVTLALRVKRLSDLQQRQLIFKQ